MVSKAKGNSWWNLLKIALAVILIFFVLRQVSLDEILAVKERVRPQWLAVGFLFFCLMTFFKARQYHVLLGKPIAYSRVLSIVITQNAISNFIANSAGVLSFITLIYKDDGVRIRKATAAFLITKLGDLFSAWLFLGLTGIILWEQVARVRSIIIVLMAVITVGFMAFVVVLLMREQFVVLLKRIASTFGFLHLGLVVRLFDILELIATQERAYLFLQLSKSISYSFIYYILTIVWSFASIYAFSVPVDFWAFIFITTMIQLFSIIPVQVFGGLGVSETVNIYLFGLFGISQPQIIPALLGLRVVFYLMNAMILLYFPLRFLIDKFWPKVITYE